MSFHYEALNFHIEGFRRYSTQLDFSLSYRGKLQLWISAPFRNKYIYTYNLPSVRESLDCVQCVLKKYIFSTVQELSRRSENVNN